MSYEPLIYREQGGGALAVRAADGGVIKGQASAAGTPAQAAHIADVASVDSGTGGDDATFVAAINAILVVLENAGLTASS